MSTRMETRRKHRTLTPTPLPRGEGKSVPRLKTLSPGERVAAGRVRVRAYRNACTCGARA